MWRCVCAGAVGDKQGRKYACGCVQGPALPQQEYVQVHISLYVRVHVCACVIIDMMSAGNRCERAHVGFIMPVLRPA